MASAACAQPFRGETIAIAHDGKGIGFDDLRYAPALHRLLVPAGRTGELVLVDPANNRTDTIGGVTAKESYAGGHGEGTTSADFGDGMLFATDRNAHEAVIIDPATRHVVFRVRLAGSPDYIRYVGPTNEVWVTEPDSEQIEIFSISPKHDNLVHAALIAVRGGPESLIIDAAGGRAFTHLWSGTSVVIDLRSRRIVARWPNRCRGSRGIAYDSHLHFLFAGCAEGKAVVMDAEHGGKVLDTANAGSGVDIIDYDPVRRHLYVPGARSATMTVFAVAANGRLAPLMTVTTARGAHCVTTDGTNAYVCDPDRGRLLVIPERR